MENLDFKTKPVQSEVEETVKYWVKSIPIIWRTKSSKQKALKRFKLQRDTGEKFINKKISAARIEALEQLLKK